MEQARCPRTGRPEVRGEPHRCCNPIVVVTTFRCHTQMVHPKTVPWIPPYTILNPASRIQACPKRRPWPRTVNPLCRPSEPCLMTMATGCSCFATSTITPVDNDIHPSLESLNGGVTLLLRPDGGRESGQIYSTKLSEGVRRFQTHIYNTQ